MDSRKLTDIWFAVIPEIQRMGLNDAGFARVLYSCSLFISAIRDIYIYHPSIESIRASTAGNKGSVVGADHINTLKGLFTGEKIELEWNDFLQPLGDIEKAFVSFMERTAAQVFIGR